MHDSLCVCCKDYFQVASHSGPPSPPPTDRWGVNSVTLCSVHVFTSSVWSRSYCLVIVSSAPPHPPPPSPCPFWCWWSNWSYGCCWWWWVGLVLTSLPSCSPSDHSGCRHHSRHSGWMPTTPPPAPTSSLIQPRYFSPWLTAPPYPDMSLERGANFWLRLLESFSFSDGGGVCVGGGGG